MIPKLHYISQGNSPKEHVDNIQKACSSGAELVLLNLKGISEKKHLKLATSAREITGYFQTRLMINEDVSIAKKVKADGVYLGGTGTCPTEARKDLLSWQIIGATANTLKDCQVLLKKEVDYISLGPFRRTENDDKESPVLGLDGFTVISEGLDTETPIIGFGAITTGDVKDILATGIVGIAVADAITKDFDTISKFNLLLDASSTAEQKYTIK
ncbi:MAG: thiamine phosphate synthase [Flavobacteriaceae bacterium]|nr:MAG: thiamine phosphate synthase [Flavobacteriaceae bacterium]